MTSNFAFYQQSLIGALVAVKVAALAFAPPSQAEPASADPGMFSKLKECDHCPEMVLVPGLPAKGAPTQPFYIGRYEVTWDEYLQARDEAGCALPTLPPLANRDTSPAVLERLRVNYPITGIGGEEIDCFVGWLTRKTGRKYRLPTEAEWEWGARAGSKTRFPWGNELGWNRAVVMNGFDRNTPASRAKDAFFIRTYVAGEPVGTFPPNAWGLHDVIGNAYEIIQSCVPPPKGRNIPKWGFVKGCHGYFIKGGGLPSGPADSGFDTKNLTILAKYGHRWSGIRLVADYSKGN